jgi:hypothetical protein
MITRTAALTFTILAGSRVAVAQAYEGARIISVAESERALATGNDAIYLNPAGLALGKLYSIEVGYLDDIRGSDRRINGSVVDSQAGPVAGGIAYTYSSRRPDDLPDGDVRVKGHRVEISTATKLGEFPAALGVTARYLHMNRKDGEESDKFKVFTVDAGFQWRIWEFLSIGLVGYNLTNSSRKEVPIGWGAGVGFQFDAFTLESDVRYNAKIGKPRFSLGAGYTIAELVPIRIGAWFDRANNAWAVSGGVGFVYDRFSIDVAYRQLVNADKTFEDGDDRILGIAIRGRFF